MPDVATAIVPDEKNAGFFINDQEPLPQFLFQQYWHWAQKTVGLILAAEIAACLVIVENKYYFWYQ